MLANHQGSYVQCAPGLTFQELLRLYNLELGESFRSNDLTKARLRRKSLTNRRRLPNGNFCLLRRRWTNATAIPVHHSQAGRLVSGASRKVLALHVTTVLRRSTSTTLPTTCKGIPVYQSANCSNERQCIYFIDM